PFYLILNAAFGGGWGGKNGVDLSQLPQEFIIDYVRVYQ
ncbi:MAG: licheninase, partial [Dysgonamonadaceae bacterium]|nr:licheninase [Dysgonamonadaceae bacterium]